MPPAVMPSPSPHTFERVAVVGLGYVGLPVALGFAERFAEVVGFDIDAGRVAALTAGHDHTGEAPAERLATTRARFTADPAALAGATLYLVCVPTPVTADRAPDLRPLTAACETVGRAIAASDARDPPPLVVVESTVYPGLTEEVCGPLLAAASGRALGDGFELGYSPERINPGDKAHTLDRIAKVVAGRTAAVTARIAAAYRPVIAHAPVFEAAAIRVAEAAKALENTQRDLNIALMNEVALICDRLGIRTADVLAAAATKWNFHPYTPGLVGGHCIGVDPYYLTAKAQALGHHPEIILAGRRLNDAMAGFVAGKTVKLLGRLGRGPVGARIGVLGLAFKENLGDLRNSQIPKVVAELADFGAHVLVHDACADAADARRETGLNLTALDAITDLDALVLAVPHDAYLAGGTAVLGQRLRRDGGVLVDLKARLDPGSLLPSITYWSL